MFGGGGLNPRKMKQMMQQMGIEVDEIDAEEVIIRTADGEELYFPDPEVTRMDARGQQTYQIVGDAESRSAEETSDEDSDTGIPDSDIELVAERTGATKEDARNALIDTDGDLAEAIQRLG